MRIGYWLRRFFKSQARIDELEEELRREESRSATYQKEARDWREGKGTADQVTNTLQFRVNEYFAENEVMRGFIVKHHGMKGLRGLAKDFMEAKK